MFYPLYGDRLSIQKPMIETNSADATLRLAALPVGDQDAFQRLIDPYQRELLVHCYRLLGSLEDAEDILQEALLRAWRGLASFEGRATLRAWLYKIATNTALDALRGRQARVMPTSLGAPADPQDPLPVPSTERVWLEPLPDALVDERQASNPEARYEAREATTLAFLAALQSLPGRQRAVLILRDVLAWRAAEVAHLLDTSVEAVNSALQRARATMKREWEGRSPASVAATSDADLASLLDKYVAAWEAADLTALIALLRDDAVLTMPPSRAWYRGREAIRRFIAATLFGGGDEGRFRLVATRANGAPAFAVYERGEGGPYRAAALQVLTIAGGEVAQVDDFLAVDEGLFRGFGLPLEI